MNLAQRVAFNTSTQLAGQALGIFVSLLTLRLTTGYLGVEEFGELAIILAVGGLVVTISDLGVSTTLARELAKAPDDADRLGGNLLRFRVASSIALVLATLAVVPALPYSTQTKLGLALSLVWVLGQSLATFPKAFFQTHLQLHRQAAVELATKLLNLAGVGLVVAFDLGFYALVGVLAVSGLFAFGSSFALAHSFWRTNLRWERQLGVPLARSAVAIGLVSVIGLLHFRGDAILLSLLVPAEDVGIYAVAFRFIDQAFVIPGLFVAAVFPILTRLVHEGPGRADAAINRTFQVLALGSLVLALGVLTLAGPIVHLIAGPEFEPAVRPARILALSLPFIFCAPVFYSLCIAVNRQRALVWMGLASLGLNVALNLLLIPRYSYNGAAAATVVSEGVSFAGSAWIARRNVTFALERLFLVRLLGATIAAAATVLLLWPVADWLAFVAGEAVLIASAYLVGAVRADDVRRVLGRSGSLERA